MTLKSHAARSVALEALTRLISDSAAKTCLIQHRELPTVSIFHDPCWLFDVGSFISSRPSPHGQGRFRCKGTPPALTLAGAPNAQHGLLHGLNPQWQK